MSIYFRSTPVNAPFMFDTIGNHWDQMNTCRPEGYPHYHYLQTEQGSGRIEVQGQIYTLGEQQGILLAPSVPHAYSRLSASWHTLFATFTGTLESSIPAMVQNRPVILIDREQGAQIEHSVSAIVGEFCRPRADQKALSSACYNLLLFFTDCAAVQNMYQDPLYQRYLAPVIKDIETDYALDLTVQSLSAGVYVTPQYLSRLFRRFLGCSVYEYLVMFRINRAKALLLGHPARRVQDIAHDVGFTDASHFIAMFKKATGSTPLEFRRMY